MTVGAARTQSGFTLIELSIAMVIVGVLLAGVIQAYTAYDTKAKIERMNTLMVTLDQTIAAYYKAEGRFPCPAPMNGSAAGNNFDQEACTGGGVLNVAGTGAGRVLIGKVPAATLGLSNDYMRDIYGSYVTYAVTRDATVSGGSIEGAIRVREENIDRAVGSPTFGQIVQLQNHTNITYLVLSAGPSRIGAYNHDGLQAVACSGTSKERENCNGDGVFMASLLSNAGTTDTATFYDDRVTFKKDDDIQEETSISLRPALRGEDYAVSGTLVEIKKDAYLQYNRSGSCPNTGTSVCRGHIGTSGGVIKLSAGDVINTRNATDSFLGSAGYDPESVSNEDGDLYTFGHGTAESTIYRNGSPVEIPAYTGDNSYVFSRPYEGYSENAIKNGTYSYRAERDGGQASVLTNSTLWVE
jgi:prepilin-type N-terminal cleavage/methylation domain-containing protein